MKGFFRKKGWFYKTFIKPYEENPQSLMPIICILGFFIVVFGFINSKKELMSKWKLNTE